MSSKKMKQLVIAMAILLICAIGGYLIADAVIQKKEDAIAQEEASLHLFSFDPNAVDTVTFDAKQGFFRIEAADSSWAVTETDYPHDFVLNTAYINIVCSYMSELTALTKFDSSPEKLADYGLAEPVVLTCYAGNTAYTLHVGNATPTQEYFYVKLPDQETVFGVKFDQGSLFTGDMAYLKSPYMLHYSDVEIVGASLDRDGETVFDLSIGEDGFWQLDAPLQGAPINTAQVNSLMTALARLEVEGFLGMVADGVDPAKYGLNKPYATLTVQGIDGSELIIDFAPYDVNDGIVHLLYRNEQEVASMAQGNLGFLNTELMELLQTKILPMDYFSVSSLDVAVDDISFRMEMDAVSGKQIFEGIDMTTLGTDGPTTFRSLFDTVANLAFEELQPDADVDLTAEPAAVFHYTLADGTETELSLIETDDSLYYAIVDGEYTGMTVRRRSLSGSTGVLTFHERMMDLIADKQSNES